MSRGRNPRVLGESLIARLRDVFLASVNADLSRLSEADQARVTDQARRLTAPGATRALELLGDAFVGIQDALDPRIPLEVALVRLTRPDADTSVAAAGRAHRPPRAGRPARRAPRRGPPRPQPPRPPRARSGRRARSRAADSRDRRRPSRRPRTTPTPPTTTSRPTTTSPLPPMPEGGSRADAARQILRQKTGGPGAGAPPARPTAAKAPSRPPSPPRPARPGAPAAPAAAAARPGGRAHARRAARPRPTTPRRAEAPTPAPPPHPPRRRAGRPAAPAPAGASRRRAGGALPSRDQLTLVWGDSMLEGLPQRARVRWAAGRWADVVDGTAVFELPNQHYVPRCEECKSDVEAALAAHFGRPVPVRIVVGGDGPDPGAPHLVGRTPLPPRRRAGAEESTIDPAELTDAPEAATSGLDRITAAFPGAEIVTDDEPTPDPRPPPSTAPFPPRRPPCPTSSTSTPC